MLQGVHAVQILHGPDNEIRGASKEDPEIGYDGRIGKSHDPSLSIFHSDRLVYQTPDGIPDLRWIVVPRLSEEAD